MTTTPVVETSATVNNSPIQDYGNPDNHAQPTCELTPGFKPFTEVSPGAVLIQPPGNLYIFYRKKAMRIIIFSKFDAHPGPIFKYLTIIKLPDLYVLIIAIFMHKFHHKKLPSAFNHYFTTVNEIHAYNTRLASK